MGIHQQLLGVAAKLRMAADGAEQFSEAPAQEAARNLVKTADLIDPNVYSPAAGVGDASANLRAAIRDLEAIPAEIRPTTVIPMRTSCALS